MLAKRIAVKITFFLNGFVYANWISRLPRIQEQFDADDGTIGLVLFTFAFGAFVAMPFTGWLIIRNGSRRISLVSVLAYCALIAFVPWMPELASLMALYLIMGIATGMQDVSMNAQAVLIEREYQRPIMTSFHAFFSIGMAIGAWCGALFSDLDIGLRQHLLLISVVSLAMVAWVSRNLVEDKPESSDEGGPFLRMPNRAMLGIGVIAFCCMLAEGAISDWSVNYMENIAGAPVALAPVALSTFATTMTISRLLGDRFRLRYGDHKLICYGGLLSTVGLVAAVVYPEPYLIIGGFALAGAGLAIIVPIAYSVAGNAKGLPPGVGLAMVTTVGYSGFLFGPAVIGLLADKFNLRVALAFVAALVLIMTMLGVVRALRAGKITSDV